MAEFSFPQSAELIQIAQDKIARLTADRPIFQEFPLTSDDNADLLMWEQLDNYTGLQQLRGLNGSPPKIAKTGAKRYLMEPGVYGEFELIDERELTRRRQWGTFATTVGIDDLVMVAQDKLLLRRLDRIEKIIWDLIAGGTFSVAALGGGTAYSDSYTFQTTDSTVDWATSATATPLADLRAVQLLHRGHSVDFGAGARAYMNRVTSNRMLNNTNAADLYGRRTTGLGTFNSMPQINGLLMADDLPTVIVYDEGYLDDSNTFQPFIADDVVIVIGQRPAGQRIGEYRMTRNANNAGMSAGPYMKVIDRGEDFVPRSIEVHDGHSGGPVMFYPSAVVVMDVTAS